MTKLDTIEIDGLIWVDKHQWSGIAAVESRANDGSLVLQIGVLKKGRPITLSGERTCWVTQSQLAEIQDLSATGKPFTLTRDSYTAQVMFRYSQSPVIETDQVFDRADTEAVGTDDVLYQLKTIKLIEV